MRPPGRKKLIETILPALKGRAKAAKDGHLKKRLDSGRTLTSDGATKNKTPLIDFLVHVPGEGVQLLDVIDCSGHIETGGTPGLRCGAGGGRACAGSGAWAPGIGAHQQGQGHYKPAVFGFYEFYCGSVLK